MAVVTYVPNVDAVLTNSSAAYFTAGTGQQFIILKCSVTNTDTLPRRVTFYRAPPAGGVASAIIMGADNLDVPPLATVVIPISGQTLSSGQALQALASVGSVVNLSVSLAQVN